MFSLHASGQLSLEENGPAIALWAIPPKYKGIDGIIN
jgi:hypothetical protein